MNENILKAIKSGHLILTSTRRLSLRLREGYDHHQAQQQQAWPSPHIISLQDWLNECWQHIELIADTNLGQLLNSHQENVIWEQIISQSPEGESLLRINSTIKMAMQAWQLLNQWQKSLDDIASYTTQDSQVFIRWALAFQQRCKVLNAFDISLLPNKVLSYLQDAEISFLDFYSANRSITLVGFDDIPPQIQQFFSLLRDKGWHIDKLPDAPRAEDVYRHTFQDVEQELYAAAIWAKQQHEQITGQIGIIIPDMVGQRQLAQKIFSEVLDPNAIYTAQDQTSPYFNISAGGALYEYPITFAAMTALNLLQDKIDINHVTFLLRSPFFKIQPHSGQTVDILHGFKNNKQDKISLKAMIDQFAEDEPWHAVLLQIKALKDNLPATQSFSHWIQTFKQFFDICDWPGYRILSSNEHQAHQRFLMTLEELATIDHLLSRCSFTEALKRLSKALKDTPFQPQSKKCRIHIMGLLEASGQYFDALWVTGLNSETWPAIAEPNAFIPYPLQKEWQMPHSTSERELYFAKQLTRNLLQSTPLFIASFYQQEGEKQLQPSPLIAAMIEKSVPEALRDLSPYLYHCQLDNPDVEKINEVEAPAVAEDEIIKGGSHILTLQSRCPFSAYAQIRWHLSPDEDVEYGLTAKDRGIIVHQALEDCWKALQSWEKLNQTPEKKLNSLIQQMAVKAVKSAASLRNLPVLQLIEEKRLIRLLQSWFALEKSRSPFEVNALEKGAELQIQNLKIKLRIDRVDTLDNGDKIILDYKTGQSALSDCFGERPDSCQLPLYAIALGQENPQGVVFAQVRADSCQFVGITALDDALPKVKGIESLNYEDVPETWQGLLKSWQEICSQLTAEFLQGNAEVDPKDDMACLRCHLQPLCRINERVV